MTRRILQFRLPDRFVVGTVGMPGERTFYLQVRQGSELVSVAFEKQQASVLAERVDQLLDEVVATRDLGNEIPDSGPGSMLDNEPLDVPLTEEFRVGAMALGWDDSVRQVVIEAHAIAAEGEDVPELADDDEDGPDTLRVWVSPSYARAFAQRARAVVDAGRPPCPFCQQPLDPAGHICPRANGYRRRELP
ncbi:MAG: DUF3090 family protein [Actinobacteria bacterium]|nr:DUF3090 family protein [Actinomycetota bacterium]